MGRRFTSVLHRKIYTELDHGYTRDSVAKSFSRIASPLNLHGWPKNENSRGRSPQENQGIVDVAHSQRVIPCTPQYFSQIRENIGRGIDAKNPHVSLCHRFWWRIEIEGGDGLSFGTVRRQEGVQMGEPDDFGDNLRHMTELHIAVSGSEAGQQADKSSEAAAINESHVLEIENDVLQIRFKALHASAKSFDLGAPDNAAGATHNRHVADRSRTQC